jgi:hypothetical protein
MSQFAIHAWVRVCHGCFAGLMARTTGGEIDTCQRRPTAVVKPTDAHAFFNRPTLPGKESVDSLEGAAVLAG